MVRDSFLRFIQKALNLSNDVKNSRNLGSEMASLDMIVYGKHTELSRVLLIKLTLIFQNSNPMHNYTDDNIKHVIKSKTGLCKNYILEKHDINFNRKVRSKNSIVLRNLKKIHNQHSVPRNSKSLTVYPLMYR